MCYSTVMKKIFLIILSLIISTVANAEVKEKALNKVSEKLSSTLGYLIPGEGITETSIELRDDKDGSGNYQFSILGVRDLVSKDKSNLFTQFSIHDQEINNDQRFIGNLGLGYRTLNDDESMMYGGNIFWDHDIPRGHQRIGLGLEVKASILDFSYNQYIKATNQKIIKGTKEQVLGGHEYNVSTQVPYMPWSTFNLQGYRWNNEKIKKDREGYIYSLENTLTPSLQFNVELDKSSVTGVKDQYNYELVFVYPPKENKKSLSEKLISNYAFEKKNMQATLKDKVRRNNNLSVEIQGSVIFTSK
jgi:hypothetical protein